MAAAGYRPEAGVRFLRLLAALPHTAGTQGMSILASHPPDQERLLRLTRWAHLAQVPNLDPFPGDDVPAGGREVEEWSLSDVLRQFSGGEHVDAAPSSGTARATER